MPTALSVNARRQPSSGAPEGSASACGPQPGVGLSAAAPTNRGPARGLLHASWRSRERTLTVPRSRARGGQGSCDASGRATPALNPTGQSCQGPEKTLRDGILCPRPPAPLRSWCCPGPMIHTAVLPPHPPPTTRGRPKASRADSPLWKTVQRVLKKLPCVC